MNFVIGVDLGTSSVKVMLVDQNGTVHKEVSKSYPLLHPHPGYSEQHPEEWVNQTAVALQELVSQSGIRPEQVEGISFSGQMHGLVLLDQNHQVLRPAILWNDTRTTAQCREIEQKLGSSLLAITKNAALEGFTLPKLLWVKENEPELFQQASVFLLPKDYLRFRMTGQLHMDYSDAAGTLLLDVLQKEWSAHICEALGIDIGLCPALVESFACVGELLPSFAEKAQLPASVKVFAGGADNACGAIGAGILAKGNTMCSIGTSGVILSYEEDRTVDFQGKVHFFNHSSPDAYYSMGVTLAAGYSLSWFRDTFAHETSFDTLLEDIERIPAGSNGLLFTPYLVGERTPHADSAIRASFIGMDASHQRSHFVRAVLEGITFSLNESIQIFRQAGKTVDQVVSIGGGAKNPVWLQMQADIFNARILKLQHEHGPAMGAAMIAAFGCGWFESLEACAKQFIEYEQTFEPIAEHVEQYQQLFGIYQDVYQQTRGLNQELLSFRG